MFFLSERAEAKFRFGPVLSGFAPYGLRPPGQRGAAAGGLPDGLPKNLKKSESGRNRKRVSLLFRPFS